MNTLRIITALALCSIANVNAQFGKSTIDYTLIIGFPAPSVDAPACTVEEVARLEQHARDALIQAGEAERGNSDGLLSYNGGQKQDPFTLANAVPSNDPSVVVAAQEEGVSVNIGEMRNCDPDCAYWCKILNVCTCCPHACCGNPDTVGTKAIRLRGVAQEDLPSKINKIRSKYMFLTAADYNIRCVDAMDAVVTVSAGYLPSESFDTTPWEM